MSNRSSPKIPLTATERRATLSLASLFILRMLGLFLLLPVLSLYASHFADATPLLIGLAIGAYGLTQSLLQIPFGWLADRHGRKRIIMIGLALFALGGMVAALADSVLWVVIGRALQGAGAIAGAVLALVAESVREQQRTKVMATIGVSIGLSFAASMILGPLLNGWIGVSGIFWVCTALALAGMAITHWLIVEPPLTHHAPAAWPAFQRVLGDGQLLRLNIGAGVLHMALTASFVAVPLALRDSAGLAANQHWQVYLPALVFAMLAMVPFVIIAERQRQLKTIFLGAIVLLCISELALAKWHSSLLVTGVLLWLFFTAFNLLEATLPSLVAKFCPPEVRATAMSVHSTLQFVGAFIGGAVGGWLYGCFSSTGVFIGCALMLLLWFVLASSMRNPQALRSYLLNVGMIDAHAASQLSERLLQVPGVAEATIVAADGIAYLKVDQRLLDEAALQRAAGLPA